MNACSFLLLATDPRNVRAFSGVGAFSGVPIDWQPFFIALLVIALTTGFTVAGVCLVRYDQRKQRECPWFLFRELCRLHQLNSRDRQTLIEIARQQNLKHPAMVFVQERLLESHPRLRRQLHE